VSRGRRGWLAGRRNLRGWRAEVAAAAAGAEAGQQPLRASCVTGRRHWRKRACWPARPPHGPAPRGPSSGPWLIRVHPHGMPTARRRGACCPGGPGVLCYAVADRLAASASLATIVFSLYNCTRSVSGSAFKPTPAQRARDEVGARRTGGGFCCPSQVAWASGSAHRVLGDEPASALDRIAWITGWSLPLTRRASVNRPSSGP
jgi:hypothetical protein